MAVATFTFTKNAYPSGTDNTQRRQLDYGTVAVTGSSPSYVQGGCRINWSSLEPIKAVNMLPQIAWIYSLSGSGYSYVWNPLGAAITNLALTSNVVTITAHNNLAAGDIVSLNGLTTTPALNGISLTVISTGLSATQFEANLTHANISSGAETGFALPTLYASGLPFQGNLMIFQNAGSAAPSAELTTASLPAGVTADVLAYEAEFIRAL